jgi:hypothetical protein
MIRLRLALVRWLEALINRLSPSPCLVLVVLKDALFDRAVALVAEWDGHQSSGEHKRHQVYAALQKEFPTYAKRTIALVIEAAQR